MKTEHYHDEPADWGDRAVRWLKVYYGDRPMKAVARDLGFAESLVALWWNGGRPSRQKLQALADKFSHESFSAFVFGFPSREEVARMLQEATSNIVELRDYAHAA